MCDQGSCCRSPASLKNQEAKPLTRRPTTPAQRAPHPHEQAPMPHTHRALSFLRPPQAQTPSCLLAQLARPTPSPGRRLHRTTARMARAAKWKPPFQHCLAGSSRTGCYPLRRASTRNGVLGESPTCCRHRCRSRLLSGQMARVSVAMSQQIGSGRRQMMG